jgi:phage terminase large subunit
MTRDAALANLRRWSTDALAFVRECVGAEPDPGQAEALAGLHAHDRHAWMASKNTGKTTLCAWAIWWFLLTRSYARIAATSITEDNLNDTLWPELRLWQARSPLLLRLFTWTKTRIVCNEAPETWFATARTWPKYADPQRQAETLAGIHADHVLFVLDESGSIPQSVMTAAEAVLAGDGETKVIQSGNPTSLEGPLYRACVTERHLWTVVHMTGDPDDPKRSPRVSLDWARQQLLSYGRNNPWCRVNVLGLWPEASLNALLGPEEVEAAMHRHLPSEQYDWAQKRIGIDASRYGGDLTVLFPRQGLAAFRPRVMRHVRGSAVSTDIAAAVMDAKSNWGSELELFDGTGGWSAGAVDVLRASGVEPIDVQFHAKALDPRYRNRRAEMYFSLAKWVTAGGALPNVPELVAELTTPTYTFVNGMFQLEDKDLIRQRLGRSPGYADALALTFALPEMPKGMAGARASVGHASCDWNPYDDRSLEQRR